MSTSTYVSLVGTAEKLSLAGFPIRRHIKAIVAWASAWATARANALADAALYEHLSRLSDAELHRRGLSRSTLARDVSGAFGGS